MSLKRYYYNLFKTEKIDNIQVTKFNKLYELNFKLIENDIVDWYIPDELIGEPVDKIAKWFYDDSKYWFLIPLLNPNIKDIIFDLPLKTEYLESVAKDICTSNGTVDWSDYTEVYNGLLEVENKKRKLTVIKPNVDIEMLLKKNLIKKD